ncbi:Glycolipid transfer protein 1 [Camellia lanceoleosa]|uniref:Glycolipid transfer protein 1 n=1 Tax=Camellia lanceoleosa TaxID=1840588 RepID=A0ACC0GW30_9ERIC|nr:Glycolipid transfer protein 1 [Camellia lanceoleosa]
MAGTVFTLALEEIKNVKSDRGELLTKPFLDVCKHILPILDKFGAAMTIVKSDIGGNISRLESRYSSNTTKFNYLFRFVQAEVETKTAKSSSSCSNALLWLTRAMDFLVELFRNLHDHEDWTMAQASTDSYGKTLKKWHGWLASSSFTIAIKLVPDRKKFIEVKVALGISMLTWKNFAQYFRRFLKRSTNFWLALVWIA